MTAMATGGAAKVATVQSVLRARFRDRKHSLLAAAACVITVLICLAVVPLIFATADHAFVVEWASAVFDLAGL
jgi:hypothetical protein